MNPNRFQAASFSSGVASVIETVLELLGLIPARQPVFIRRTMLLLVGVVVVLGGAGCGLPAKWHRLANKMPQATPEDPAFQMLCVWEPAEGVGSDGLPTRGFAGKITFFTRGQKSGVRVNGDVRIYVYDDQSPPEDRGKPIHQWDFLGDAWAIHLQDSSLGPSYSVFIPYSRKGNHQALCALRVRLTPADGGPPVYSDTVAVLMPGTETKSDEPVSEAPEKRRSLETITIPLKERKQSPEIPLGEATLNHTVAPVSELIQEKPHLIHTPERFRKAADDEGRTSVATLPLAPPDTLPVEPVPKAPPAAEVNPFEMAETGKTPSAEAVFSTETPGDFPTPSKKSKHPLLENSFDLESGSNPFNR